jgi:hypothetical protein
VAATGSAGAGVVAPAAAVVGAGAVEADVSRLSCGRAHWADWAAVPSLESIRTAGNEVVADVSKPSTMLLPNIRVVPLRARSGEIAPLNAK